MAALQPRRRDGRVHRPRRGRQPLGRRDRNSPRDIARPLGRGGAAGLQPGRRDLYTASDDGMAIAWDIDGSRRLGRPFRFTHDRALVSLFDRHPGRFSPDGRLVAVGLKERGIQLWDTTDLTRAGAPLLETGSDVKALAFAPDGRTLAAVTRDGDATVWDVESRSLSEQFGVDVSQATGVSFSSDGTMLATAGTRASVVGRGNRRHARPHREGEPAADVAFSPTAPIVAFVRDGWVTAQPLRGVARGERGKPAQRSGTWPSARGSRRCRSTRVCLTGTKAGYTLAFSPDGRMLASPATTRSCTSSMFAPAGSFASSSRTWAVCRDSSSVPTAGPSRSPASQTHRSGTLRPPPR